MKSLTLDNIFNQYDKIIMISDENNLSDAIMMNIIICWTDTTHEITKKKIYIKISN